MTEPQLLDLEPRQSDFRGEVLTGLAQKQKTLPCKFFYDAVGSKLFDQICALPEYYVTRTEIAILGEFADSIAERMGPRVSLVELGSGSSTKTRLLLDALVEPAAYVPLDISREHLLEAARRMASSYPGLRVMPVCADFTDELVLPTLPLDSSKKLFFFPGSTIGNLSSEESVSFLEVVAHACGPEDGLLIGVDLVKDVEILERAYNDSAGVTARFNLNLLARINRELDGDFKLESFRHSAVYNQAAGRIESHIVSLAEQRVRIGDASFDFAEGERIWTESSHKYTEEGFAARAATAGFEVAQVWTDRDRLFSVQLLVPDRS